MSFQKIAAEVHRQKVTAHIIDTVLKKRADAAFDRAQMQQDRRKLQQRKEEQRQRLQQRRQARQQSQRPAVTRPSYRQVAQRTSYSKPVTRGQRTTTYINPRDNSNVHYTGEASPTYTTNIAPAYGSDEWKDLQKAVRDDSLYWDYGRDPAIEKNIDDKVGFWTRWFGSRDSKRQALVKATTPKLSNQKSQYSNYVKQGQTMSAKDWENLVNARAQEYANFVVKNKLNERQMNAARQYFRLAANQRINDWHGNTLKDTAPGEEFAQARGIRNQGTNPVLEKFDFSGFSPDQIRQMKSLGQTILLDY